MSVPAFLRLNADEASPNPATSHQKAKHLGLGQCREAVGRLQRTVMTTRAAALKRIRHYDKAEVHKIPDIPSVLQHGTV